MSKSLKQQLAEAQAENARLLGATAVVVETPEQKIARLEAMIEKQNNAGKSVASVASVAAIPVNGSVAAATTAEMLAARKVFESAVAGGAVWYTTKVHGSKGGVTSRYAVFTIPNVKPIWIKLD